MTENHLAGLWTLFAMIAFLGVCFWAYSAKRKHDFDEAANLPFADDPRSGDANGNHLNDNHANRSHSN